MGFWFSNSDKPIATHLPFVITKKNDKIILTSHFAKANEQTINVQDKEILIIFSEPHAYISPKYYDKKQNVPTWNYLTVHTYGKVEIITFEKEVFLVLEQMISSFDKNLLSSKIPRLKILIIYDGSRVACGSDDK